MQPLLKRMASPRNTGSTSKEDTCRRSNVGRIAKSVGLSLQLPAFKKARSG